MFDFFKQKEISEIKRLKQDLECLTNRLRWYQNNVAINQDTDKLIKDREIALAKLREKELLIKKEIELGSEELARTRIELEGILKEIDSYSEIITIKDVGLYSFKYKFTSSEMYKSRLDEIKEKQKQLIINNKATVCSEEWSVNGSSVKGESFVKKMSDLVLRCFNSECDTLINSVKYNKIEVYKEKVLKIFTSLNRLNSYNHISITDSYLKLKIEELILAHEYELKKHQEKEDRRIERERIREEEKIMKEIEERRKDIEKELKHYSRQIEQIVVIESKAPLEELQHIEERKKFINMRIEELRREIEEMDYREANKKAGYVYIISNIGSFGENVYKIGMTRRLEPTDRIDELSSASVPFKFDIHAMIFCEDAPKLEAELHRIFDEYKVNAVNSRKEFFKVDLEKIKEAVRNNFDKTVEFVDSPYSMQYLETLRIKAEQ